MAALNCEISDHLKHLLDVACATRGIKKVQAVTEALSGWLGVGEGEGGPEDPYLVMARRILESGDTPVVEALQASLRAFDGRLRPRR